MGGDPRAISLWADLPLQEPMTVHTNESGMTNPAQSKHTALQATKEATGVGVSNAAPAQSSFRKY